MASTVRSTRRDLSLGLITHEKNRWVASKSALTGVRVRIVQMEPTG